jgi:RHS repeat-associated protein
LQKNRYGFQGQEWQKDLDLGWSQFKWRMHDPAIGRFGGVDPLADKYLYNSTYAFSENKVTRHIELEGLESLDFMTHWGIYGTAAPITYAGDWLYDKIIGGGVRMAEGFKDYMANETRNLEYQRQESEMQYLPQDVQQRDYTISKYQAEAKMIKGIADQANGYMTVESFFLGGVQSQISKVAGVTAQSTPVVGMSDDAASFASQSLRRDHAMRHFIDDGVISGTKNSSEAREAWAKLVNEVLTKPDKSFDYYLQGANTKGFYKKIDGKDIVMFVTRKDEGSVLQGQVIGGWVPTKARNPDIFKLLGF